MSQKFTINEDGSVNREPYNKPNCPDNNMLWAVLSTIFCCLPLGIVSIVHASRVKSLYQNGAYESAVEESEKAKKWAIYAAIPILLYWGFVLLAGIVGSIQQ